MPNVGLQTRHIRCLKIADCGAQTKPGALFEDYKIYQRIVISYHAMSQMIIFIENAQNRSVETAARTLKQNLYDMQRFCYTFKQMHAKRGSTSKHVSYFFFLSLIYNLQDMHKIDLSQRYQKILRKIRQIHFSLCKFIFYKEKTKQ